MNEAKDLLKRCLDLQKLSNPFSKIVQDIEAYLAKQQVEQEPCVHEKSPEACYRVRCQLGKKCMDDDLSFRHTPQAREQQVEQEPIGTVRQANGCTYVEWNHVPPEAGTVCYAAPQAREQVEQDKEGHKAMFAPREAHFIDPITTTHLEYFIMQSSSRQDFADLINAHFRIKA